MAEIQNVAALSGRLVGIIWGDAKTGKTTWACSLPGKKLLLNFDPEGFSSVAYRDDVDIIDLSTMTPTEAMREADKLGGFILENAEKYDSIILDSLTTLTEVAMHDAIEQKIGKSASFTPTVDAPGLAAYGGRNNRVNSVISKILRATGQTKLNCFFIAHADDPAYDKDGKTITHHTIMLSAKIRNAAALKVSEIYHLNMDGDRRTVYLAPFGVKKPMGSRVFDTAQFKSFRLEYDINKPDEEQQCSLQSIVTAWKAGGFKKLTNLPEK
jgi:phage nucleotide-binding protein